MKFELQVDISRHYNWNLSLPSQDRRAIYKQISFIKFIVEEIGTYKPGRTNDTKNL